MKASFLAFAFSVLAFYNNNNASFLTFAGLRV